MSCRWSFQSSEWDPSFSELSEISGIIQPEEKARIARFHFKRDAKSSLIGRLLIRKLINIKTNTPNDLIQLARDERNKPILVSPTFDTSEEDKSGLKNGSLTAVSNLNFNVSHQGNYVVLASDPVASQVGIDVMNIQKPGRVSKNTDDYFKLMNKQFTADEWQQIRDGSSEQEKLANFTRFWCLKESYVKAIGVGIVMGLKTIEFHTKTKLSDQGQVVTDTKLRVHGILKPEWKFEERYLDGLHIVAVAKELDKNDIEEEEHDEENPESVPKFEEISLEFLLENMVPRGEQDLEWVEGFLAKK